MLSTRRKRATTMIGLGVYTLAEVSRYTGVPSATVRSWFRPRSDKRGLGPIFHQDYEESNGDFAVSFLGLVDAYVASFFKQNNVKPHIIRRAHTVLQKRMGTEHPFAHASLSTDGIRILEDLGNERDADVISKQLLFPQFRNGLARTTNKLGYNPATLLAEKWHIADGIVVNPRMGFGKPVVDQGGISTLILAKQYVANHRDAALVARVFKTSPATVMQAVQFETGIRRIAA